MAEATGYYGRRRDEDWLKLPVHLSEGQKGGILRVELSPVDGVAPQLKILSGAETLASARAQKGEELRLRNVGVPAAADTLMVDVKAAEGRNLDARWLLKIGVEPPLDGAEAEPNDTVEKANPVAAGQTVSGFLWPGDADVLLSPRRSGQPGARGHRRVGRCRPAHRSAGQRRQAVGARRRRRRGQAGDAAAGRGRLRARERARARRRLRRALSIDVHRGAGHARPRARAQRQRRRRHPLARWTAGHARLVGAARRRGLVPLRRARGQEQSHGERRGWAGGGDQAQRREQGAAWPVDGQDHGRGCGDGGQELLRVAARAVGKERRCDQSVHAHADLRSYGGLHSTD